NFRKVKRIEDVVLTFANIRNHIPAKLLLVGDGPERAKIEQLTRDLDVQHDVRFLGKIDVVEEVLSVADLFLMPSEKESFGLAALEAMSCEVPIISSNTGGLPELQINGVTGFMSNVGDVADMSKNALTILAEGNLARFKEGALNRAKEFDITNILPLYQNFYTKVVEEHAALHQTEKR
ncbi:MAG: glycosyltransferase, partial [Flexibacteraceae bacterium]